MGAINKINCIEILIIPSRFLLLCGQLQTQKLTPGRLVKIILNFLFNSTILTLVVINIYKGIKSSDTTLVNWMTCVLVPMINYTFKGYSLLINKNCLLVLLEYLQSDVFNSHSEEQNRYIQLVYRISVIIMRYFILAISIFIIIFCILPIVLNIRMMIPPPFDMGPFDVPYKLAVLFSTAYIGANSASFDVFYMSLMSIGIAQLNILEDQLSNAFWDLKIVQEGTGGGKQFEKINQIIKDNLRKCIMLHKTIIQFTKRLNVLLAFPLFIQYTCGCFVICNAVLQMTIMGEIETSNIIGMCGYSSVAIGQMAVYHWLGNEFMFRSNKIVESCYLSNWYSANIESRRVLILLMERAKRPLVIELYTLVLISLDSLAVILRWAYSIFALIKAKYN